MKKMNLTLKKEDFWNYYLRKLTKDWSIVTISSFFIFSIASIIYNPNDYFLLLILCLFLSLYLIKILKTIKRNLNQPFSLSITNNDYEILRQDEKGKWVSTYFEQLKNFLSYDQFKNYIFIKVQKRMTFILRKDMFSDDEWETFIKNLKTQVGYKKTNMFIVFLNLFVSSFLTASIIVGFING